MDARRVRRPLGMAAMAPKRLSALAAQDGLNVIAGRCELAAVEADQLPRRPVVSARPAAGACEAVASLDVFSVEAVVVATAGAIAGRCEIGDGVVGGSPVGSAEGHDILLHLDGAGVPHGGIRAVFRYCQMTLPDGTPRRVSPGQRVLAR